MLTITRTRPVPFVVIMLLGVAVAAVSLWPIPASAQAAPNEKEEGDGGFVVGAANPQMGWVTEETIAPNAWKPVDQPDLAARIKAAPKLELENVLPGPRQVKSEGPWFAPNEDGSWDILMLYRSSYMGPKEMAVIDTGTGETFTLVTNNLDDMKAAAAGKDFQHTARFSFHLRSHYFAGGKLFFDASGYTCPWIAYDPKANAFVWAGDVFSYRGQEKKIAAALSDDGKICGLVYKKGAGCIAYRIDPADYSVEKSEPFGPKDVKYSDYYQSAAMDGDWIYAEFGSNPWHVVGYNFKTREGRVLAVTQDLRPDQARVNEVQGGASGTIRNAVSVYGLKDFDRKSFDFWIKDGKMYKRDGAVPPWSKTPAKPREPNYRWDTNSWFMGAQAHWLPFVPAEALPPEVEEESVQPGNGGVVSLRYRPRGSKGEWKTAEFTIKDYPGVCRRIVEVNERVIFASNEGYGDGVFMDVAEGKEVGRLAMTKVSPYSMNVFTTNKLYVSGYPTSQMWELDLMKPLGAKGQADNPKFLGYLAKEADIHTPLAGTLLGADGKVYNAGCTVGRRREGGGFCWYDPATGKTKGVSLGTHRVFWATTACDGRYVLMASKGEAPRLICWDTQVQKVIYEKKILGGDRPGPLVEALPGLVIGYYTDGSLYGVEAATGEVLWSKKLPAPPVTAFAAVRRHAFTFRRGPEGMIWATVGDTLVRIDPRDVKVTPVGKAPQAQVAFAAGGVYVAGNYPLQRIKGLTVKTTAAPAE